MEGVIKTKFLNVTIHLKEFNLNIVPSLIKDPTDNNYSYSIKINRCISKIASYVNLRT